MRYLLKSALLFLLIIFFNISSLQAQELQNNKTSAGLLETEMREMLSFISTNCRKIEGIHSEHDPCNYNYKIRLPSIELKSEEEITAEGLATYKVEGLYFNDEETIYLPNKKTPQDLTLLIHELYHHVQNLNGADEEGACDIDVETPAFKVQLAYIKLVQNDENFSDDTESSENQFKMQGVECMKKTLYKWYEGEYKDGDYHGKGTFNYPFGSVYEGEWKNGKKHGQGTFTYTNGDKYVGKWKDGKENGQGSITWVNGDSHQGNFVDGKENGFGTKTWSNGNSYQGIFKDGETLAASVGKGTLTWANGDSYQGEWKDWQQDGKGTFIYGKGEWEGQKYVGEWKNDLQHGQGTWIIPDGSKWVGEMRDGRDWNTTGYDEDGNIIGKYVNGVEQ